MSALDHQSIGEVLATLRDEFPDITISKIRFLESQGLIDPERTPSGYRKFRDGDVARLRWILQQQKENFLPLKVIKARLDEVGPDGLPEDIDPPPATDGTGDGAAMSKGEPVRNVATGSAPSGKSRPKSKTKKAPRATKSSPRSAERTTSKSMGSATSSGVKFESPMLPLDDGEGDDLAAEVSGASFTRSELASVAGLTAEQLGELEEYGLVAPAAGSGDRVIFDEDALVVAKLAAEFAGHGIGPRHLRMFRVAAEREAGLYDQVIAPRLLRRNPEARAKAREDLVDLARLGRSMRAVLLRGATVDLLHD